MQHLPSGLAEREHGPPSHAEHVVLRVHQRAFIGRGAELAGLITRLDAADRGEGSLVLLSGEPGIGKTRLASEFTTVARARKARVHWGRCWEGGGAPAYWPWIEVLRELLHSSDGPESACTGRDARLLAQIIPELAGDAEEPPIVSSADPESTRFQLFDSISRFLRTVSRGRSLVLILEDLQAADRVSLWLLSFLARNLEDCAVLIIGTYRDLDPRVPSELAQPLAAVGRHALRTSLQGLTLADVRQLIAASSNVVPDEALVSSIHGATDGTLSSSMRSYACSRLKRAWTVSTRIES